MGQPNPSPSTTAPAPAVQAKAGRETILAGCKLPHGILLDMRTSSGESVRVKLNGYAVPVQATERRKAPGHEITSGVGLTTVDKELFEAWLADHQTFDPVARGFIFKAAKADSARDMAADLIKEKTGFEPLPASGAGPIKPFSKED